MGNAPLTEWQIAYVTAHVNDRPRVTVARAAGLSMGSLYRIVRRLGGTLDHTKDRRNPEWERIVKEHYATMTGHEIERKFGMTNNYANKTARRLGLRHGAETEERIRREALRNLREGLKNVDQAAKTKRWKTTRRLDEMRVWNGEPQRTRFRMKAVTRRAYAAMWNLMRKYGYYFCEGEPYTLLYDDDTRRRPVGGGRGSEEFYAAKYGIEFHGI